MVELPKHIIKSLRTNRTSLGEHPAFPPEEEEKFIVNLVSDTFNEIVENTDIEDVTVLENELSTIIGQCRKIEKDNIQALEELSYKIITEMFDIPSDTLKMEGKIVNKIDTSTERLVPEKTEGFSFDDIEDMNYLSGEIYKRRMLNALVAGASMYYMNYVGKYIKEIFEVNPDLPSLYKKMIDYNNLLLYISKDTLNTKETTDGGKVDVTISSKDEYPIIKAEGLLFPILFEEIVKGILELAISHGLPNNVEKAKYVISKADFKIAEVWDMRLGYALWKLIQDEISECGYDILEIGINFFLMELSQMDTEEFNSTLKEIFARTKKGKRNIDEIVQRITYNKDKDEFDDYIKTKNDSTIQINDDEYFTPEELITDNYGY